MRLQRQALLKHPQTVMLLLQTTTANSKPPAETTVKAELGHGEREHETEGKHTHSKRQQVTATLSSLCCLQHLGSCCSCSLSLCVCP